MKKNRVKILLIAIIVPVLLTGCGVSPEQLAAKGIYPEEYRADSLAANIENAAKKSKENDIEGIKEETLAILMEEYIATLFRLVTSDRDKETIINCMKMIGRVYETGITNLMKKEQ